MARVDFLSTQVLQREVADRPITGDSSWSDVRRKAPGMHSLHAAVPLLHDSLTHSAHRLPGKTALVCGPRRLTYAELEAHSNALAHHLVAAGVTRGDRVLIFADNAVEPVIAFWAALKANAATR